MNINLFSSLFNKKTAHSQKHSPILKTISSLTESTNLFIYNFVTIFHHKEKETIPTLLYDEYRGLYIFENKEWSYDQLKTATIDQTQKASHSDNTLAFNRVHEIIIKKLKEINHDAEIPIHNYLIMNHLSSYEYQDLDDSIKKFLPKEKLIFNNLDAPQILEKFYDESEQKESLGSREKILGALLTQYTILDKHNKLFLCNSEQQHFIDKVLEKFTNLKAEPKSGKSSTLLLKAIFEILKAPSKKVLIIKPTMLAKDILHRQLLEIIEHGIIEFDVLSITVLTPQELVNMHLQHLKKKPQDANSFEIDALLLQKAYILADIVMCDDADLIDEKFIDYLKITQKSNALILVNSPKDSATLTFHEHYIPQEKTVTFYQNNTQAKSLFLISKLLKKIPATDILIVSNNLSREKLQEDLKSFIKDEAKLLDSSLQLTFQNFSGLQLATYQDINELSYDYVILLDTDIATMNELIYTVNVAQRSAYILYEEESEIINALKEKYENS